jgi:glyoxylase-like metal-dependent hydrolase (beta-lactamase superfamily II)
MSTNERYHFQLGDFECIAIRDAVMAYPIDEVFPDVPREQLAQALADHQAPSKEIVFDYSCLLVDTGKQRLLIDTGCGHIASTFGGRLTQHLKAEGIAPQDIDVVVLTHGDMDHIGGIADAKGEPAFPSARCIMWKAGWDALLNTDWTQVPEESATFKRNSVKVIERQIEPVEANTEFTPGLRLIPATGHKPGHAVVSISSAGRLLLHVGDAIGHPTMVTHPEWSWTFDLDPERATADRQRLIEMAIAQNALVFGSHLPFPGIGRIVRKNDQAHWQQVEST